MDKDEIAEELEHHRKMLKELRRRLRERELQEVKHGINVPTEITSHIYELTERIQRHESEVTRLQTLAAEDEEPLGEVEYRAVLAEIWEKSAPRYSGSTRLELIRLRYGIMRERANELEKEVRSIVAAEMTLINEGKKIEDLWHCIEDLSDQITDRPLTSSTSLVHSIMQLSNKIESFSYPIKVDTNVALNAILIHSSLERMERLNKIIRQPPFGTFDDDYSSIVNFLCKIRAAN